MTDTDLSVLFTEARSAVGALTEPIEIDEHLQAWIVPEGYEVQEHDFHSTVAASPRRRKSKSTFIDVDSFVEFVDRHATDATVIFTKEDGGALAVFNDGAPQQPGWRDDAAAFTPKHTPEWKAVTGIDGNYLEQTVFAEWLEDNLRIVTAPDAADLIELAQSFKASKSSFFRSDRRLANGQVQLEYVENVTASGGKADSIKIPEKVTLSLAVFKGEEPQPLELRFRYRLKEGVVTFGLRSINKDIFHDDAVLALHDRIATGLNTDMPVLNGEPSDRC